MHPNKHFRTEDRAFHNLLIEEIEFGMVFAHTPDGPRVAHTPMLMEREGKLRFHLARGNALTRHLPRNNALIVVNGPDAYVSARWYEDPNQVPTWNYIAVEAEGSVQELPRKELSSLLEKLSERHEARIRAGTPWTMDKLSEKHREGLLNAIVGFEMSVDSWRETAKLSQNKPSDVRAEVITGLEQQGETAMANLMRNLRP